MPSMSNVASAGDEAMPEAAPVVSAAVESVGHADPRPGLVGHYRLLRVALGVIRLGPVLSLAGLIVGMSLESPVFLTTGNVGNVLSQTAVIAVLAVGQLLVILTRGIDLSVGSTLALASVVGAIAFEHGQPGAVVVLAMLATGAAVGFVNGAGYVWGRLPHPFIITL